MIKNILFDLDGTLTDPKVGITKSIQFALSEFGIIVDNADKLCAFIGPPLQESFIKFYNFNEENAKKAVSKYREYFSVKGIYENALYNGVPEMLTALKRSGKTNILATSKPAVYAEQILRYFNIYNEFSFISGSELDGRRSIKGEVIRYALEQNNITDLNSAVMVGDREHDIIGAKKTGLKSIGVLYGYGSLDELTCAGADRIAGSVDDLFKILSE